MDEYADLDVVQSQKVFQVHQIEESTSLKESLSSQHAPEWGKTADVEYHALIENETWLNYRKGALQKEVDEYLTWTLKWWKNRTI